LFEKAINQLVRPCTNIKSFKDYDYVEVQAITRSNTLKNKRRSSNKDIIEEYNSAKLIPTLDELEVIDRKPIRKLSFKSAK